MKDEMPRTPTAGERTTQAADLKVSATQNPNQNADLKVAATQNATQNGDLKAAAAPEKKPPSQAQLAANRANLAKAMAAQRATGYRRTPQRLAASRRNIAKGRAVYRRTMYALTPQERAKQFIANLAAARAELDQNGQHLWHGMTCPSLLKSLRPAGEKLEDLQQHFARLRHALQPCGADEQRLVDGVAELLWRRWRGLRLGSRWEARKLAAVLEHRQGGAPPGPQPGDSAEEAAERAWQRGSYARELAFDILQVFGRAEQMAKSLDKIQRRMLVLIRRFGRRCGEPLLWVQHCGEKREEQAAGRDADSIGNPFAPSKGDGTRPAPPPPFFPRQQEEWNVNGLGKAESVDSAEKFRAALLEALATMNQEALAALKDLAETVCARLRLLEEEARQEAAELRELLAMEPAKKNTEERQEQGERKRHEQGAGAEQKQHKEKDHEQDADLKVGATKGATEGKTPQSPAPYRFRPPLEELKERIEAAIREAREARAAAGPPAPKRWRGFNDALEILAAQVRGSKTSPAFGVCLALGIADIIVQGENRLLKTQRAVEEALMKFLDHLLADGCGENWGLKRFLDSRPKWVGLEELEV